VTQMPLTHTRPTDNPSHHHAHRLALTLQGATDRRQAVEQYHPAEATITMQQLMQC